MGRGLSDLQTRILIAVHRLEKPVWADLRAEMRAVAVEVYGDDAKSGANRVAFTRAVTRLEERGLLERYYPGIAWNRNPKTRWLVLTEKARELYRLTSEQHVPELTDSEVAASRWIESMRLVRVAEPPTIEDGTVTMEGRVTATRVENEPITL